MNVNLGIVGVVMILLVWTTGVEIDVFVCIAAVERNVVVCVPGEERNVAVFVADIEMILPIPGEAKAKAMPGWLYIHTK